MAKSDKPKYEVILYWSDEDKAFIAEVPELPGCASDGSTYERALKNVERVVEEWIETAKEEGRSIPEPKKVVWFLPKILPITGRWISST